MTAPARIYEWHDVAHSGFNEFGEQVTTMDRSDRGPLTDEEKEMIANMDNFDDEYDEDCPPMPEAMIVQMRQDIASRRLASVYA